MPTSEPTRQSSKPYRISPTSRLAEDASVSVTDQIVRLGYDDTMSVWGQKPKSAAMMRKARKGPQADKRVLVCLLHGRWRPRAVQCLATRRVKPHCKVELPCRRGQPVRFLVRAR